MTISLFTAIYLTICVISYKTIRTMICDQNVTSCIQKQIFPNIYSTHCNNSLIVWCCHLELLCEMLLHNVPHYIFLMLQHLLNFLTWSSTQLLKPSLDLWSKA